MTTEIFMPSTLVKMAQKWEHNLQKISLVCPAPDPHHHTCAGSFPISCEAWGLSGKFSVKIALSKQRHSKIIVKKYFNFHFFPIQDPTDRAFIPCLWLCCIIAADIIISCLVTFSAYSFVGYSRTQVGSLTDTSHLLFPAMKKKFIEWLNVLIRKIFSLIFSRKLYWDLNHSFSFSPKRRGIQMALPHLIWNCFMSLAQHPEGAVPFRIPSEPSMVCHLLFSWQRWRQSWTCRRGEWASCSRRDSGSIQRRRGGEHRAERGCCRKR